MPAFATNGLPPPPPDDGDLNLPQGMLTESFFDQNVNTVTDSFLNMIKDEPFDFNEPVEDGDAQMNQQAANEGGVEQQSMNSFLRDFETSNAMQ